MRFYDADLEDARSVAEELVAVLPEDHEASSVAEELLATLPDNDQPWERLPVSQLSHDSLTKLVTYLRRNEILELEDAIKHATINAVDVWKARRDMDPHGTAATGQASMMWMGRKSRSVLHSASSLPLPTTVDADTVTLNLPPWLLPDEAMWLAERQIREQVEGILER